MSFDNRKPPAMCVDHAGKTYFSRPMMVRSAKELIFTLRFRQRTRLIILSIFAICFFILATGAEAKDRVSFCFNDFPPYAVTEPNGDAVGISIMIVRKASERLNIPVTFVELPWERCLFSVQEGLIDGVLDAASRLGFAQGPLSYSSYKDTLWVRDDSMIQSIDDMDGLRVGIIQGYEYSSDLLRQLKLAGAVTESAVDDPTNTRKLAFRRVDAIIGDLVSTAYFARENDLRLKVIETNAKADPLFVSFNPGLAALQSEFNSVLDDLKNEGFVNDAYIKYLGEHWTAMSAGAR